MTWQEVYGIMRYVEPENAESTKLYWSGEAWTSRISDAVCFRDKMNCLDYVIFMEIVDKWLLVQGRDGRWFNVKNLVTRKVFNE